MEIITGIEALKIKEDVIISFGKFDGIHAGHHLLLNQLKEGQKKGLKSVIFTFAVSPKVAQDSDIKFLTTNEEKMQIFQNAGIDYVILCPFSTKIMRMEPVEFLKMLFERVAVREIVVGTDFRFGYQRSGDYRLLQELAGTFGYQVYVFSKKQDSGSDISSTRIRQLISQGKIEEANRLLEYEYSLYGTVAHGNAIGRTIAMPTANLIPAANKLLPPFGVYASKIELDHKVYYGVTNIGKKPTISGSEPITAETYIFDFSQDIYDRDIRVSLVSFIRKEQKFQSLEALKEQMELDKKAALKILS